MGLISDLAPRLALLLAHCCLIFVVVTLFCRLLYRTTFHPLAKFPGPRLAAVTNLYAAYYDILGGSYVKKFPGLHETYGPIVRIAPNELHFKGIQSRNEIYRIGTPFHKDPEWYDMTITNGSLISIPETAAASRRRAQYSRFFSVAAVRKAEFLVREKVDRFVRRLQEAACADLSRGFRCLAADIIVDYSYQEDFGGLSAPGFVHRTIEATDELTTTETIQPYFPRLLRAVEALADRMPAAVLSVVAPAILAIRDFQKDCARSVRRCRATSPTANDGARADFIFRNLVDPKDPECLSDGELTAEAVLMLIAGMDTTANALIVGTWGLLRDEAALARLKSELREHIPDSRAMPSASRLERLPYLTAVVKESRRLSFGAPGRLRRLVPRPGAKLCNEWIPGGTSVSHSNYVYHTDETVFPQPHRFSPERWLQSNAEEKEKHLFPFPSGSRVCLGMNLAKEELVLTFAYMFRRLIMSVFQTTEADMTWIDGGVPVWKGHLKVQIEGSEGE